ncbi:MAG: hypothetical protein PHX80_05390 [Candidatus Nanoarchaeia archaeon]|nr:hypothetical protein [Candidatus Nanoarchaeia archaeon]
MPSKETLAKLYTFAFYLFISFCILRTTYPIAKKFLTKELDEREVKIIKTMSDKQDRNSEWIIRYIERKANQTNEKIDNVGSVLSGHIIRTEKDSKTLQETIEKLYNKPEKTDIETDTFKYKIIGYPIH